MAQMLLLVKVCSTGAVLNRDEEQENISTRNIPHWRRLHLFLGDVFTLLDLGSSEYLKFPFLWIT